MTRVVAQQGFSVGYGQLERMLAKLSCTTEDAIRVRFRKLRLRPFPDDIQTGTGVKVRYDLPRVLAIAAAFELNALQLPQGQSAHLVERSWPELGRAFVAAAVGAGTADRPAAMPRTVGPMVTLFPDAFASGAGGVVTAARADQPGQVPVGIPLVLLDARRFHEALAEDGVPPGLPEAVTGLELALGWTPPPPFPDVTRLKDVRKGVTFLERGPFFERAEAFLTARDEMFDPERPPPWAIRQQALLDYLQTPAPIDVWKGLVGEDRGRLRLNHLIAAVGKARGLRLSEAYPDTVDATAGAEHRELALSYVRRAAGRP